MTTGRRTVWILQTLLLLVTCHADEGMEWTTAPNMAAPVLNLHRKEMTLDRGSDFVVTCMGTSNLTWTYPDVRTVLPLASLRRSIMTNQTGRDGFLSVFRLTNVQYSDTGLYTCQYSGGDEETGEMLMTDATASVYIYVPDDNHLFAPPSREAIEGHPIIGIMYAGSPYVLACRPTHPRTNVTLRKSSTVMKIGDDITYDKKEGFTIHFPTYSYQGMFYCDFSYNGSQQTLTALLNYKVGAQIPQPEVDASHSNILVGETLKLKCIVKVQSGTILHIEWEYPSKEHSSRIRLTETNRYSRMANGYQYEEIDRSLVVKDVTKIDAGVYRCTATTHDGKSNYHDTLINVYEHTFVHLTPMDAVVEVPHGTSSVYLSMSIHAYPRPNITWYWHNQPITVNDRRKEVRVRSDRTKLKLYNVQTDDAGDYVVRAESQDMNATEKIRLIVTEPATVSRLISLNKTEYHLVDKYYTMTCDFYGIPRPEVTWSWQPCLTVGCTTNPSKWNAVITSKNVPQIFKNSNTSRLTVLARESGFYRCTASNKMGTDAQNLPFYVTDVARGFKLSASNIRPIEGDTLSLTCQSHALIFSLPRMYILRGNQHILMTNSSDQTLTQTSTKYSHVLTSVLSDIELNKSGSYYCQAEDKFGERHQTSTAIQVIGMEVPRFTKQLHGEIYIKPGTKYSMECRALGLPPPTIHWFKDDIPINETNLHYKLNTNHTRLTLGGSKKPVSGMFTCEARNRAGNITSNTTLHFKAVPVPVKSQSGEALSNVHIGLIVAFFIVIIGVIIFVTIITRRCCQPRYYSDEYLLASKSFNPDLPIDVQPECIAYDPKWEFPRDRLTFGMLLGQGAFGKVVRAEAFGIGFNGMEGTTTIVAVKMPKDFSDTDQMKALLSELKVLIHVGQHLNIVNLLGACTKDMRKGVLYVIVEYCRYGNLLNYLLKKRQNFVDTMSDRKSLASSVNGSLKGDLFLEPGREYVNTSAQPVSEEEEPPDLGPLTTKDLLCYAFQIARGMDYLASRKYIHRDLAARNVLLADGGIVKIADFGLAKDCYKYDEYQKKTNGPVPVKWLALESLTHKVYTTKSDVWSYGVLLWELFTVGGNPYPGVTIDETFVERLKNGFRMERPPYATEQIYGTMLHCWAHNPEFRPDFAELATRFGNLLQASVRQHYIDLETQIGQMTPDGSTTGYLRMAGSTLTSYVPMSSEQSESARTLPEPETNGVVLENDSGYDYSELMHLRQPQLKEYNSPTVETVNECDELTDSAENIESLANIESPTNNNNGSDKDITMETTAMVHTMPPSDKELDHDEPVDPGDGSDCSPFLNRTDSDKSDESGPRRGRQNLKDSVSSDASSGFHSCYYPDDSPTDYPNGLIMNGIPPKEVMV